MLGRGPAFSTGSSEHETTASKSGTNQRLKPYRLSLEILQPIPALYTVMRQKVKKTCRSGLHSYDPNLSRCPDCRLISQRANWHRHKARYLAQHNEWVAANRQYVNDYSSEWSKKSGYKHQKAWKLNHKDKVNSYTRKRQALICTTAVEFVDYATVVALANGLCQLCKEPFGEQCIEIDHIIPLSNGGSHTYDNVHAVHAYCNRKKGARTDTKPEL